MLPQGKNEQRVESYAPGSYRSGQMYLNQEKRKEIRNIGIKFFFGLRKFGRRSAGAPAGREESSFSLGKLEVMMPQAWPVIHRPRKLNCHVSRKKK